MSAYLYKRVLLKLSGEALQGNYTVTYVNGTLTCAGAYGGGMFGKIDGHTIIKNCYAVYFKTIKCISSLCTFKHFLLYIPQSTS